MNNENITTKEDASRSTSQKDSLQKKLVNKRKFIILLLVFIAIVTIIGSIGYYFYNQNKRNKEAELWSKIQEFMPNYTREEIAFLYGYSIEDLTIENLEEIIKDQEEYLKETEEYNKIYKEKVINAKNHCIDKVTSEVFNKTFTGTWNGYNIFITPGTVNSISFAFMEVNPKEEQLMRIGMTIIYHGIGTAYLGYDTRQFGATGIIGAELNLESDELNVFYIEGCSEDTGQYNISQGSNIDWVSEYNKSPYIFYKEKNGKENLIYYNMDMNDTKTNNIEQKKETNEYQKVMLEDEQKETNDYTISNNYIGHWTDETNGKNQINIKEIDKGCILFDFNIYRICTLENLTANITNNSFASFNTNNDDTFKGIYGTLEFKDNQIILKVTASSSAEIHSGDSYVFKYQEDINAEKVIRLEITDTTGINGIYTSAGDWKGNASNYNYIIQNGQIEYEDIVGAIIRQGTYTKQGNKLYVTYNKQYNWCGDPVELQLKSEVLVIQGKDTLNSSEYIYTK